MAIDPVSGPSAAQRQPLAIGRSVPLSTLISSSNSKSDSHIAAIPPDQSMGQLSQLSQSIASSSSSSSSSSVSSSSSSMTAPLLHASNIPWCASHSWFIRHVKWYTVFFSLSPPTYQHFRFLHVFCTVSPFFLPFKMHEQNSHNSNLKRCDVIFK